MISEKISETSHDVTSIQVVIVQSEEGEYLSLRWLETIHVWLLQQLLQQQLTMQLLASC